MDHGVLLTSLKIGKEYSLRFMSKNYAQIVIDYAMNIFYYYFKLRRKRQYICCLKQSFKIDLDDLEIGQHLNKLSS